MMGKRRFKHNLKILKYKTDRFKHMLLFYILKLLIGKEKTVVFNAKIRNNEIVIVGGEGHIVYNVVIERSDKNWEENEDNIVTHTRYIKMMN